MVDLLTLRMRNMWSRQGLTSSLNCPAILLLEFQPTGNESPIALPWAHIDGGTHISLALG